MRINEITLADKIEEGPLLNKIGSGIGKLAGGAAKAVGAVAGGVAGAGKAIAKGYRAGRDTVASAGDQDTSTAGSTAASTGAAQAPGDPAAIQQQIKQAELELGALKDKLKTSQRPSVASTAAPAASATAQPSTATAEPDAATQARIAAAPQGYDSETGKPAASATPDATATTQPAAATPDATAPAQTSAATAKPAATATTQPTVGKTTAPANKAATDTFEKAKGDIRKVQSGTKPLPDQMAQGVQADIAKMAKGDKESGVAAAQKIMGFAGKGMDVAALQQAWSANAKAGERFLSQSVYRSITNMLGEYGLAWKDLGISVRLVESVSEGVFIKYINRDLSETLSTKISEHKRRIFETQLSQGTASVFVK